jgi:murein DD-endopeptidase MepM/ murein hydrolase activator NlpD
VGNTGLAAEPHLHFELRSNGCPIDPAPLLGIVP